MRSTITVLVASAALAAAADRTTVSVFIPQSRPQPCDGSVVNVGAEATTYSFKCYLAGTSITDYGVQTWHVAQGPSTWVLSDDAGLTEEGNCKLDAGKDVASCQATRSGTVSSTEMFGYKSSIYPVTITAGANKLPAAGATVTGATATAGSTASTTAKSNAAGILAIPGAVIVGVAAVARAIML
ncbi:hypothetical protein DCS_00368 [Drechmeria coniospora]|uniref:Ig-like domain-containing protein n=1 Tax=Drechmeria coniospora TaxID=98403 RepID=A0A151GQ98_DRECN|nr:hypothetical protein DCS_00368 [Drechmeria coniospora]KAH8836207.1 hypothetical protein RJ55_10073 [Drechmeria coniospora]KYK59238.1 hypothetical protein DCS_00368 [Drechmeria coniospora]